MSADPRRRRLRRQPPPTHFTDFALLGDYNVPPRGIRDLFERPEKRTEILNLGRQAYRYKGGESKRLADASELYRSLRLRSIQEPFDDDSENADVYACLQWLYFVARTFPKDATLRKRIISDENKEVAKLVFKALPQEEHYKVSRLAAVGWMLRVNELQSLYTNLQADWKDTKKRKTLKSADEKKPMTLGEYRLLLGRYQTWQAACLRDADEALKLARKALDVFDRERGLRSSWRPLKLQQELVDDQQKLCMMRFRYWNRRYKAARKPSAKAKQYITDAKQAIADFVKAKADAPERVLPYVMPDDMKAFRKKQGR